MDRIIYIAPSKSSFILQDIEELGKHLHVEPIFFEVRSKVLLPWYMAKLFFQLLFKVRQPVLISFGGYHSLVATFVATLKGVKSYIILNGIDSANIPEYSYGYLRGGAIRWCCKISYQWVTKLLPVSESLMNTNSTYGFEEPKRLGLKNEFQETEFNYQVIPNGFDSDFWKPDSEKEEQSFLTVVGSKKRITLKGLDLILEVALEFPDCTFYVVGLNHVEDAPRNVKMLGFLNSEQLRSAYSKAKFYLQLSVWEGFGCALCEAMLCGCIPIVSTSNVLPEIVGDTGYLLRERSNAQLATVLNSVLGNIDKKLSSKHARDRICERYPLANRTTDLLSLLHG